MFEKINDFCIDHLGRDVIDVFDIIADGWAIVMLLMASIVAIITVIKMVCA